MTIRTRIVLFAAGVVAITGLIFGLIIYGLSSRSLHGVQNGTLRVRAASVANFLDTGSLPTIQQAGSAQAPIDLRTREDAFDLVFDLSGKLLYSGAQIDGSPPMVPLAVLEQAGPASSPTLTTIALPHGLQARLALARWSRPQAGGYVASGQTYRQIDRELRGLRNFLWLVGIVCLGVALAAMWLVTRAALRPLTEVAATADAVADGSDLSRRLPPRRAKDEVGRLTHSFNGMLARLQDAYLRLSDALEAQKRFVGDASHELRTPLTTIRNNAGLLLHRPDIDAADRQAALQDIADEGERMGRLVQNLLTLARADGGFHLPKGSVRLSPLLDDVGRQARQLHPDRTVEVRRDAPDAAIDGNADALRQLLWILIDNAAHHTRPHGRIQLSLARAAGATIIGVADDGEGIPAGALAHIFERFYQASASRSGGGAGIGLSIAAWIAAEHGAQLSARNSPGGGATFTLAFPDAPEPPAQPLTNLSSTP